MPHLSGNGRDRTAGGPISDLLGLNCDLFGAGDAVDYDSDGAVAGDVAGCAETVHGDVEGDHQRLCFLVEAEH